LSFPGREPGTLGRLVYEIHHYPTRFGLEGMSAAANQALHIAAHLDAIERQIAPLLNAGEHVLLDRFWWSTWVYGVVGGASVEVLERLIAAERVQWGPLQPSLVVLLDRDEPINRAETIDVWKRIRSEYLTLASKEKDRYPVEVVQNTATKNETGRHVLDLVLFRLSSRRGSHARSCPSDVQ
jgi:dTMP kinase